MKILFTGFLSVVTFSVFCQPPNHSPKASFVASVSEGSRMTLVKTSIPLTEWHAKSFWIQYREYLDKIQAISAHTYIALQELAHTNKTIDDLEAYEKGSRLIAYRFDELAVMHQYFVDICSEHNGVIGLQFIQTETMLDIMESSHIYEESPFQNFRFLPKAFSSRQSREAKYNIIIKALALSPAEAAVFMPIYVRYEKESEELLGEEYNLYELFAGEASDYTPALARRQGYDLLSLLKREIRLKEKYFIEMNATVCSSQAARFLAWEDYYSFGCKMIAWVDAP